jgi:chaperonin GroEL
MNKILNGKSVHKKILSGVRKLNGIVGLTIGPKGRNVIIDRADGVPLITNDGVTITKTVNLPDACERLACDIIKQASLKTNDEVGDGTTSAVILSSAIVRNAIAEIKRGADPNEIKDGLLSAAAEAVEAVNRQSAPCKRHGDLLAIAVNSCANSNDGRLVADAFARVGADGLVTAEENQIGETKLRFNEGMCLPFELPSPYFIDDIEKEQTVYTNAKILMTDGKISGIKEILPILEHCVKKNVPLAVMADDYSADFISALLVNRVKSNLRVIPIKYGVWAGDKDAILHDISAITNSTIISQKNDLTLQTATDKHLGTADKIIIGRTETTILNDTINMDLSVYIERLRAQMKSESNAYKKTRLRERISKLENGIAIISVGCPTAAETREKVLRVEDAINAAAAAMRSGIVVGGGLTYYNLSKQIEQKGIGARILCRALPSIIQSIYKNAGLNFNRVKKILHGNWGYNAKENKYCDLFAAHIIDPAAVVTAVIRNAVSAAAILITSNGMIVN